MDQRVRTAIAFMNANLNRALKVRELAGVVDLSPSHLAYLFRKETGKSAFRYLLDLRIKRGKNLLETTSLSVKQIATRVGQSSNHFSENFKEKYRLTPGRFASRHRRMAGRISRSNEESSLS